MPHSRLGQTSARLIDAAKDNTITLTATYTNTAAMTSTAGGDCPAAKPATADEAKTFMAVTWSSSKIGGAEGAADKVGKSTWAIGTDPAGALTLDSTTKICTSTAVWVVKAATTVVNVKSTAI